MASTARGELYESSSGQSGRVRRTYRAIRFACTEATRLTAGTHNGASKRGTRVAQDTVKRIKEYIIQAFGKKPYNVLDGNISQVHMSE
jgi:hypothetical protein